MADDAHDADDFSTKVSDVIKEQFGLWPPRETAQQIVLELGCAGIAYGQFGFLYSDGSITLSEFGHNGLNNITLTPERFARLIEAYQHFQMQQKAQQMEDLLREKVGLPQVKPE